MAPGVKIFLGDKEFTIPPITLGMLRGGLKDKMAAHDKLIGEGDTHDILLARGEIIIEVMRRNYTEEDLPTSEIWDRLDLQNVHTAWLAILGASGFTPGEEVAGEKTGT